ncbi:MAG: antibiotic biosynthesis monooxygenase [Desulfomicrobium sp.]|jgi:quinol monooxygenase YgiN|nr:antibiotic biosynthesis monooxygenase [Desulfomicrobium sp.]NLV96902.1 antibiotic biosynthesis monooxygenase [Desulfovibrionales bacterium]
MIHVVVRVMLKKNMAPVFLRIFRELATVVRQEPGCLDYFPTKDVDCKLSDQEMHHDTITVVEKWSNKADLERHLRSGHMRSFHERTKDIVLDTRMTITEEV